MNIKKPSVEHGKNIGWVEKNTGIRPRIYLLAAGMLASMLGIYGGISRVIEKPNSKKTGEIQAENENDEALSENTALILESKHPKAMTKLKESIDKGIEIGAAVRMAHTEVMQEDYGQLSQEEETRNDLLTKIKHTCKERLQRVAELNNWTLEVAEEDDDEEIRKALETSAINKDIAPSKESEGVPAEKPLEKLQKSVLRFKSFESTNIFQIELEDPNGPLKTMVILPSQEDSDSLQVAVLLDEKEKMYKITKEKIDKLTPEQLADALLEYLIK